MSGIGGANPLELLTRVEAMKLLKLKPSHFSKLVNGYIRSLPPVPCIRIGRRQLFRREALERWLLEVEACNADRYKSSRTETA